MNSFAQLKQTPPHAQDNFTSLGAETKPLVVFEAGQAARGEAGCPNEAATILEDVRRAIERNLPEGARIAALRLVSALSAPLTAEPPCLRGGLAPWQRRKVDRHLRENLERPVQIEELAELLPLSISHFCRAFKESFGDTPHAYLIRLRLEAAQAMMLSSTEPLSQIALATGFGDQAHLSKQFRRVLGGTPSAWRRRNLTEAQAQASHRRTVAGCER